MATVKDDIVLVTGSARGIGRATAIAFAKEGARVVINDFVEQTEIDKAVEEIKQAGGNAIGIRADVSNQAAVKHMFHEIKKTFGRLDVLINNAGIARRAPFLEASLEDWDLVLKNNLTSMFLCSQEAARIMLPQQYGRIVNMCSVRGMPAGGNPSALAYSVAKAGIIGLTTTLAKELAPYITVNAIAPSFIDTDIAKGWSEETRAAAMNVYIRRLVTPDEVADAYLYFASRQAAATTGQVLAIDGGYLFK